MVFCSLAQDIFYTYSDNFMYYSAPPPGDLTAHGDQDNTGFRNSSHAAPNGNINFLYF